MLSGVFTRMFSSSITVRIIELNHFKGAKVAILGASGGIGQPLSLLLKLSPYIRELDLYDLHRPPGVAVDLSHINTSCEVHGLRGVSQLPTVLTGSDVVIIPAGVPRKPGMTRDDLFLSNAKVGFQLADYCSRYCPEAKVLVITNPVNSILPLFSEVYRRRGINGKSRLFGVTNLDSVRASTFVASSLHISPHFVQVPVVGGHAGITIIPLLSQLPTGMIGLLNVPEITKRIQFAGDEVVDAKGGAGSATLAMAYAASQFVSAVLRAMNGEKNIVQPAFVQQEYQGCHFFSSLVKLGKEGVAETIPVPSNLTRFEMESIRQAIPLLIEQAQKGIDFVSNEPLYSVFNKHVYGTIKNTPVPTSS